MGLLGAQCLWTGLLFHVCVLQSCWGISVRFLNKQPVYVVSGQTLVLQAQIDLSDYISKVTWEHDGKRNSVKTLVAEFPSKSSSNRVTLERDGAVMNLRNYQRIDSGEYTVTVTDTQGRQESAVCTVHEYEAVHHVSVMVNVSHSVLHCREAWGTEPVFSWLHEQVAVTEAVGRVFENGSSIHLSIPLCGHFTCVVSNKLGYSSATYTAEPCEKSNGGTAVAVVFLLLLLLLAGALAFLLWRRHSSRNNWRRLMSSEDPANRPEPAYLCDVGREEDV